MHKRNGSTKYRRKYYSQRNETVPIGSIWELDVSAYKLCGEVYMRRIDGIQAFKINITELDLENYFELAN